MNIGQATELPSAALPIHPLDAGIPGVAPAVYTVFTVEDKGGQALPVQPVSTVVGSLGIALTTEAALPIGPRGSGALAVAVAQAPELGAALPVRAGQAPARVVRAGASMLPTTRTPETVAVALNTTGVTLQLQVTDSLGNPVDLTLPTELVIVIRTERGRWEVTPLTATASGFLVAQVPDAVFRRAASADYQIRAAYPDGWRVTRAGRILISPPLPRAGGAAGMASGASPAPTGSLDQRVRALEALVAALTLPEWWTDLETFTLVADQADYLFPGGAPADTDASRALVQWGALVLVPITDYAVLPDRIRLTNPPSAEQSASGEPLVIRFRRG